MQQLVTTDGHMTLFRLVTSTLCDPFFTSWPYTIWRHLFPTGATTIMFLLEISGLFGSIISMFFMYFLKKLDMFVFCM